MSQLQLEVECVPGVKKLQSIPKTTRGEVTNWSQALLVILDRVGPVLHDRLQAMQDTSPSSDSEMVQVDIAKDGIPPDWDVRR